MHGAENPCVRKTMVAISGPKRHHADTINPKRHWWPMHRFSMFTVFLSTTLLLTACENQSLQNAVTLTIASIEIDHTAVDDQEAPSTGEKPADEETDIDADQPAPVVKLSPIERRFNAYTVSRAFIRRLREAAIVNDAYLGRACPEQYRPSLLSVLHQPTPALAMPEGAEHPTTGIWRARYTIERCGEAPVYNAVFGGRPNQPPNMRISNPGTTAAGSELAREMREDIADAALELADLETCSDQRIVDTRADEAELNVQADGSEWARLTRETWSIDVCGRQVDVALAHGLRDGVHRPQYVIEHGDGPVWKPSGRSVAKDIDPIRLQSALHAVISGDIGASLDYLWGEARREVPFAQTVIAGLFRDGVGVERNMDRAAFWALRAAYDGYAPAMEMIGEIYQAGSWVVRDQRLAAAWYRRAVKAGSTTAKARLASLKAGTGKSTPSGGKNSANTSREK